MIKRCRSCTGFSTSGTSSSVLLFLLFTLLQPAAAQEWRSHTSMRQVVDLTASEDAIWTATSGGVFKYAVDSGDISRFTTTEGLYGLNIRAIEYDLANRFVWVGYQNGVLDRIDVDTGVIRPFLDIQRATQFQSRDIRNLQVKGDTLIVATGFGVVLFNVTTGEVLETYVGFGTSQSSNPD